MESVIQIDKVWKSFGPRPAVRELSLSIPQGSIYALLGDNGAGKTTTIRMLTGLLHSDSGQLKILNHDCWKDAVKLRHIVGFVPEKPRFYDWMTIGEIGWFTSGFHTNGYRQRYQELIGEFKLELGAKLRRLSKGQYAKVALSLALAANPKVLILDEPTSGLDLIVRREFLTSMVDLAAEGRTILISSHQIAEVERVASHVAFMAKGRLLLNGTLEEIRQRLISVSFRHEADEVDVSSLGTVLERQHLGKQWQISVMDPDQEAIHAFGEREDISDLEVAPLTLEEAYCALLTEREKV